MKVVGGVIIGRGGGVFPYMVLRAILPRLPNLRNGTVYIT